MITDDNPFDDMTEDNNGAFGGGAPPPRPPKEDTYTAPPRPPKPESPVMTTSSATTIDMSDYERRLADLEARERAVAERERKVAQDQRQADEKMQQAATAMQNSKPAPNWPPCLPKKIVYMDFQAEIPDILRTRCRMAYIHFLGLLSNATSFIIIIIIIINIFLCVPHVSCAQFNLLFLSTTSSVRLHA